MQTKQKRGKVTRWALKSWCFQIVLEKTLESPLDQKEIKPLTPKGSQPWIFIRKTDAEAETPLLWPSDAKSRLLIKDPDAGKDWRREEKGTTEDEMVGWYHRLNGHEFEQTGIKKSMGYTVHGSQNVGHKWANFTSLGDSIGLPWYPSSVQFSRSVVSDSLWPHELQHTRHSCPSLSPRIC